MAQALKIGERVMVKTGFRTKPDSSAYQQGLKSVKANVVGEVAGPAAEGRALLVNFDGVQVPVKTQNLVRAEERPKKQRSRVQAPTVASGQDTVSQPIATPEPQQPVPEAVVKKTRGGRPKAEQAATQLQPDAVASVAEAQQPSQEPPAPKKRGRRLGTAPQTVVNTGRAEPAESVAEASDPGLQLLTLIANKLLLKGNVKVQADTAVEVSLRDLPSDVQKQLQRLLDAKLSLDLKSLGK